MGTAPLNSTRLIGPFHARVLRSSVPRPAELIGLAWVRLPRINAGLPDGCNGASYDAPRRSYLLTLASTLRPGAGWSPTALRF
jgi:hypothetical protein